MNGHFQDRTPRMAELARGLIGELNSFGVEASYGASPGIVLLRGQELDGVAVNWRSTPIPLPINEYEAETLYFVLPDGKSSLDQDWLALGPSVRITRRRNFPLVGSINGLSVSAAADVFSSLRYRIGRDAGLINLLLGCADAWRTIEIIPIVVGRQTWPPGALAIAVRSPNAPPKNLFDCYARLGVHMREMLHSLSTPNGS